MVGRERGEVETSWCTGAGQASNTEWIGITMCYLPSRQEVQLLGPGPTHCSHRG